MGRAMNSRPAIAVPLIGAALLLLAAGIASAQQRADRSAAPSHRVAIHVDDNDAKVMNLALNNAKNVLDYYQSKGETVAIEIVTYGPGLHMLRADTSPVKTANCRDVSGRTRNLFLRVRQHPSQHGEARRQRGGARQ